LLKTFKQNAKLLSKLCLNNLMVVRIISQGYDTSKPSTPLISNMTSHPAGTGANFQEGKFIETTVTSPSGSSTSSTTFYPKETNLKDVQNVILGAAASTPSETIYEYQGIKYKTADELKKKLSDDILKDWNAAHPANIAKPDENMPSYYPETAAAAQAPNSSALSPLLLVVAAAAAYLIFRKGGK